MSPEEIKAAIEAEAKKKWEPWYGYGDNPNEDHNKERRDTWASGADWLLSEILSDPAKFGLVKVEPTGDLKFKVAQSIEALIESENYDVMDCAKHIAAIAQAYAAEKAVGFAEWAFQTGWRQSVWTDDERLWANDEHEEYCSTQTLYQQYKQEKDGRS